MMRPLSFIDVFSKLLCAFTDRVLFLSAFEVICKFRFRIETIEDRGRVAYFLVIVQIKIGHLVDVDFS